MSHIFGAIRQLAFVVRDIDEAMVYWARTLGIGPFFIKRKIQFSDYCYRGQVMHSPTISIALAHSGSMQVELIQQHDQQTSLYRDFLQHGQAGLQHVAAWFDHTGFIQRKAELLERGYTLAQECTIPSSGVQLAYFATDTLAGGPVFELADLLEPVHASRLQGIADAAAHWDGKQVYMEVTQ